MLLKTDGLNAETLQPPDFRRCGMTLERSSLTLPSAQVAAFFLKNQK